MYHYSLLSISLNTTNQMKLHIFNHRKKNVHRKNVNGAYRLKKNQNDNLIEFLKKKVEMKEINKDKEEDPINAFSNFMALAVKKIFSNVKIKKPK